MLPFKCIAMITTDTINPVTVAKYTKEEIEELEGGESIFAI